MMVNLNSSRLKIIEKLERKRLNFEEVQREHTKSFKKFILSKHRAATIKMIIRLMTKSNYEEEDFIKKIIKLKSNYRKSQEIYKKDSEGYLMWQGNCDAIELCVNLIKITKSGGEF